MEALGNFENQRQLWKVKPQQRPEMDYFTWEAELQVSTGPLRGASLVYSIHFATDYPFKPPTIGALFMGFPVAFHEVQVGWHLYMVPPKSSTGQRQKATVIAAGEGEISVRWIEGSSEEVDEPDEGEVDVIHLSSFEACSPVLGQSNDAVVYHPLLDAEGRFCTCGIRDRWQPHCTILTCLSFAHAAIEDPTCEDGTRPVPVGSSIMMCFCTVNAAACQDFQAGSWPLMAKRRFFTEKGVAPLCINTTATEPGNICIVCTSLAGSQLGEIQINSQQTLEDLENEVQEPGRNLCLLVLPCF